jgi:hypothetical protein
MASKEYDQALEILNWEEGINGNEKILINSYTNVSNFTLNGRNVCFLNFNFQKNFKFQNFKFS